MIRVRVRFFGSLRKLEGRGDGWTEIPESGKVSDLRQAITCSLEGPDRELLKDSAFASESRILHLEDFLTDGTTVAVLPPVCGG